ncbi:CRISPR-associated protein Csb1 [Crossiella equi]|uniref:CRISPR-associated protein Csb1 n=1 Tax=Crossiella equi TaxID=130796 RepID=A0ABS5AM77_9PSEU|nr:type I-U CRISPR-associated RAMP protein Csb1/Cas7u [Crossiella equi]MBP2477668.1 CRISPR-associated protein Csb1 [Crossiella equi]
MRRYKEDVAEMGLYERLEQAVSLAGPDAAITVTATLQPVGGPAARVFPPTYPVDATGTKSPYVVEPRLIDGEVVQTVVLDSVQSESNRIEEAVEQAVLDGRLRLPYLLLEHQVTPERRVRVSSFTAPHRYADAYHRDSLVDGVVFDKSPVGKALRLASVEDCRALYEREPFSLILGAWDSHRKGRAARFARLYRSEIFGIKPQFGHRAAGRMDPSNLSGVVDNPAAATDGSGQWDFAPPQGKTEKAVKGEKGSRVSSIGHGNIAPTATHGGVTLHSATRLASVSMAGLARLRFGDAPAPAAMAARMALAALTVIGDRLAFGVPALWLRSGCELVVETEQLSWQQRGGGLDPFEHTLEELLAVFTKARQNAATAGLTMVEDVVRLTPGPGLAKALEHAYLAAAAAESQ